MNKVLGVCQIGCGRISGAHLQAYQKNPAVKLVAVVDEIEGKAKFAAQEYEVPQWYTDYRRALERKDVDLVDVSLPHYLHCEVTIAAAKAGKHVLVEKPIANTLEEARLMVEAARQGGVKLMVNQTKRFQLRHQMIKRILEMNYIGKIILAKASYPQDFIDYITTDISSGKKSEENIPSWALVKEKAGGGVLLGLGIHSADILRWLVGEVGRVSAFAFRSGRWKFADTEDTGIILLEFKKGGVGEITTSFSLKDPFVRVNLDIMPLSLYGERGAIHLDASDHLHVYSDDLPVDFWGMVDIPVAPRVFEPQKDPFANAIDHFVDCILNDREPLTSGEEGLKSLEVIMAAYRSLEKGSIVSLPLL